MLLPQIRARLSRGDTVFAASVLSFSGMFILAFSHHWVPAMLGMLLFGVGWVAASAVSQGAAQLSAPAWVRSRALAIYQLAFNGALAAGTFFWGWLGTMVGLPMALSAAAGTGLLLAVVARRFDLDRQEDAAPAAAPIAKLVPEDVAPELATIVTSARGRVLEQQHYRIAPADRERFLAAMADLRDVRGRAGALIWQLYEDVAHPEGWIELWTMENWTDHLREAVRMSEDDHACLARVLALNLGEPKPPCRYLCRPAAADRPRASATERRRAGALGRAWAASERPPTHPTGDCDVDVKMHNHETKNDLKTNAKAVAMGLLNARLADGIDLSLIIKQAHWNLKGRSSSAST